MSQFLLLLLLLLITVSNAVPPVRRLQHMLRD
jgi:hypothetical protein